MGFPPRDDGAPSTRPIVARIIDSYNPGITLLVLLWIGAFAFRARLVQHGTLEPVVNDALRSLLCVIPIMLVGWAVLAVADRKFRLGLFKSGDNS